MGRRKKELPPPPAPVPIPEPPRQVYVTLGETLGLIHPTGTAFLVVKLIGVTVDTFIVLDEDTKEEMVFSRATGHRRNTNTENWEFWHLAEEDLGLLNKSSWKGI